MYTDASKKGKLGGGKIIIVPLGWFATIVQAEMTGRINAALLVKQEEAVEKCEYAPTVG